MTQEQAKLTLAELLKLDKAASLGVTLPLRNRQVDVLRALRASQTALRELEWSANNAHDIGSCPDCGAEKPGPHDDRCKLGAALLDQGDGDAHKHEWETVSQESNSFTRQVCECGATQRIQL